jgi:biopolymer transport protein ExbD
MPSRSRPRDPGPEVTLPITPMLDMTFQLLFFFIATYHRPTGLEGQMDLALPSEAKAKAPDETLVDTNQMSSDDTPDLDADVTVIVQTQTAGTQTDSISALTIRDRTDVHVDYDPALAELQAKLKDVVQQRTQEGKKLAVRIQGDARLKWKGVVKVMDACRKAGFDNVGFVAPPDLRDYSFGGSG